MGRGWQIAIILFKAQIWARMQDFFRLVVAADSEALMMMSAFLFRKISRILRHFLTNIYNATS